MTSLLQRFPNISAILPVYAVIAVPIFGWTITFWLWKLPSWLKFLTLGEIAAILSYALMIAFFESMLICGLLLLLCFLLPSQAFRDRFVVRGTWLAIGLALAVLGKGAWRGMTRFTYIEISLTATILTGRYPWWHRALNLGALVARGVIDANIFRLSDDIDEKKDLRPEGPAAAALLKEELLDMLSDVNKSFETSMNPS
jgi:hypothetical protein